MKVHTLLLVLLVAVHISSATVEHSGIKRNYAVTWSSVWASGAADHNLYKLDSIQAWSALALDQSQWIQISSPSNHWWTAVVTQGRANMAQWVTKFRVSHSRNGVQWTWVDGGREFVGNFDQTTELRNNFDKPVYGQHIRIHPTTWFNHISLRFDAIFVQAK